MSWWSKHITRKVSAFTHAITGSSGHILGTSTSTAVDEPAAAVSAPSTSDTTAVVNNTPVTRNTSAKGKRKLMINIGAGTNEGINI